MRKGSFILSSILTVLLLVSCSNASQISSEITPDAYTPTPTIIILEKPTPSPEPSPEAAMSTPDGTPTVPSQETEPTSPPTPEVSPTPAATPNVPSYDEGLNGKYICLTFDDGPATNNTPKVLKALKEYGVKATFFVCGPDSPTQRQLIRDIYADGHTIGLHCYSHALKKLYQSEESFLDDFYTIENMVIEETGYQPTVYRFPGGTNTSYISKELSDKLIVFLEERGYEYYDWNVGGDDEDCPPAEEIAQTVITKCRKRANAETPSIVLLHDSAGRYNTGDAVPMILETLTAEGFHFISLSHDVVPVHFVKK